MQGLIISRITPAWPSRRDLQCSKSDGPSRSINGAWVKLFWYFGGSDKLQFGVKAVRLMTAAEMTATKSVTSVNFQK